jgi:hypothetical protein
MQRIPAHGWMVYCLSGINVGCTWIFFATAPWNYYGTAGKMRRIGSGLVYFTIKTSLSLSLDGEFVLYALGGSEEYCEKIGMVPTGDYKFGLKKFHMSKDKAVIFERGFRKYVVSE